MSARTLLAALVAILAGVVAPALPAQAAPAAATSTSTSAVTGNAVATAPAPGRYSAPVWLPIRSASQIGCARASGGPVCNGHHSYWALDLIADQNIAVHAAGAGQAQVIVSSTTCNGPSGGGGLGRHVIVDHGNGVSSVYAHLHSTAVRSGQWVDETTVLGAMGKTGRSTCGANHLHYEKRVGGVRVDPGSLRACHGSRAVTYPEVHGRTTWDRYPGHSTSAHSSGTGCAGPQPVVSPLRFTDVARGTWFHDPVGWMAERGVTTGCSPTTYCPFDGVTRAQMATFLWRLAGSPSTTGAQFDDVDAASYAATAIRWMRATGLSTGVGGGRSFEPARTVTRAEMVTMLHRFAGAPASPAPTRLVDVDRSAYFAEAVGWAGAHGITTGVGGSDRFEPHSTVDRAQTAAFIVRYVQAPASASGATAQHVGV